MIRFGYGTNGFANHRLTDALDVIAGLGYTGVALTLDHHHLDPYADGLALRVTKIADRLRTLGLGVVVETGARYLLDPRRKHAPTLLDDDRDRRIDFLNRAVAIGADLGAEAVSCWSGIRPAHVPPELAWERLVDGCARVLDRAGGVPLGFEPEPGMLVDTIAGWHGLRRALGAPDGFGLTLDIGHCRCNEPDPVPDCVTAVGPYLVNVQIDDMRRGTHEHLEFGDGEIDFPPVLRALAGSGYRGLVAVELPRHSHAAPDVAARSLTFLRHAEERAEERIDFRRRPNVMPPERLRAALRDTPAATWLDEALTHPDTFTRSFTSAGRRTGRAPLPAAPGWTADEAARALLLAALPQDRAATEAQDLYHHGDADEKRAVLKALALLPIGPRAVPLLHDAIRTNDARLLAAALGPYATHLDQAAWRQAVLKCVFMGVPLSEVDRLDERADAELAAMLTAFAEERQAAGRPMPADAAALLSRLTSRLTSRPPTEES
ncbi:EboA domain-containing protein [Nonomuraea gerenzanensis]|uniref:Putaive isomerase n=1 Tax=Nonomuraea gerenzanensis TaxID=93944 RepID=A0A1M4E9R2_9ACTN|nr:EboA domain-containing protein [Nonomuraea gerenzanensis]UBU17708.1 EboA domain-containing protein [Nonomuraea gerenzanensis]SBO95484.1 putaive isomerase [Nonomuraea gerenzanensis]